MFGNSFDTENYTPCSTLNSVVFTTVNKSKKTFYKVPRAKKARAVLTFCVGKPSIRGITSVRESCVEYVGRGSTLGRILGYILRCLPPVEDHLMSGAVARRSSEGVFIMVGA
eukprot:GHVR01181799.1.p2 GENE.GHVR01181799.1~~GHVR01181799.1.p2  ORF type:complete len:112 (-),score=8.62 GHVR01181799.1:219-554(-)